MSQGSVFPTVRGEMRAVSSFLRRLKKAAVELGLSRRKVLVAVSGGPDSVALLLGLAALARPLGMDVEVATIDHGLRVGSEADCAYVARMSRRLGVVCTVERVHVGTSGGMEAAARKARYRALENVARMRGADLIATAHTLDDQAETVLLRLARGAGTRGLRGILPRRGRVVRPMLEVSRPEVATFLKTRRVRPRCDPTNVSSEFDRNRVRADVLPAIERALGRGALRSLARAAAAALDDERFLDRRARDAAARLLQVSDGRVEAQISAVARLDPALRRRVLLRAARALGLRLAFHHVQSMERALVSKEPVRVSLPHDHELCVAYGRMRMSVRPEVEAAFAHLVPGIGTHCVGPYVINVQAVQGPGAAAEGSVRIDPARLALPLWLRSRRPGDRFRSRGGHSKKLKAFLIDCKIPREERERLPLLCDDAGRVLWLVGVRASDAAEEGERASSAWQIYVGASGAPSTSQTAPDGGLGASGPGSK